MKRRLCALTALAAVVGLSTIAHANVQIGNFKENSGSGTPPGGTYTYSNSTGTLTATSPATSNPGVFSYGSGAEAVGAPILTNQASTLAISVTRVSGSAGDVVSTVVGGTTHLDQLVSGSITITAVGGTYAGDTLLQATFTNADLGGTLNGGLITLTADTTAGSTVTYSSNVPGFNVSQLVPPSAVTFTLNPIQPNLTVGANNNFTDFTGQDTANFSANIASTGVPEPTTMALALTALPIVGLARRLRRKGASA